METNRITPRSPRAALEPEQVPEPARRSKKARHPYIVVGNALFTIVLLVGLVAGGGLVLGKQKFEAPGPLGKEKVLNIPRNLGVRDIAELLMREGVVEHQLTIPEGLTSEQIVARLVETDILAGNITEIPREGTLLPETYRFTRGTPREQVIQRMQHAQRRVLQEIWERRSPDLPVTTPEQLVVLASVVEKETGKPEERTRVAAVFVNRLKQKMKLESDPTIIYGLVGGKGTLGRPIQANEIRQPSPYNTYVIDGLPPGPIANPGRASLEGAANPARTKELFFVADGTGGHTFADNYEAHQKNVARLRVIEQGAAQSRAAQPPTAPAFAPAQPATSTPRRPR